MNIDQFWRRADDLHAIYRTKYRCAILTDDEQLENVSDFLVDMDVLASEWHNRNEKEKVSNGNKTDSKTIN
jgi:hypothetical protein